jgi:hypothetical protein
MERDVEGRVGGPDSAHHLVRAGGQAVEVDGEMREPPGKAVVEELVRALAHGAGRQEAAGRDGIGCSG